jgi:hypothetical protein
MPCGGLAVYLPQCGGSPPPTSFDDRVVFGDDKNVIEGNNISGRLSGNGQPWESPVQELARWPSVSAMTPGE